MRQNLLMENKTGKYFKYAFGEIVLVVIGILIALQINYWNNQRIERKLEFSILKELASNLDFDLKNIDEQIKWNEVYGKHNRIIYEHLKNKTPLTDSLKFSYASLIGYGDFLPMTITYENLKSEGINIIKNEDLRKEISKLYDYDYRAATSQLIQTIAYIQERHLNEVIEHLTTEQSWQSAKPVDLLALQNDIPFQESLKSVVMTRNYSNEIFIDTKKNILKVKMSIENELKIRNK